MNPLSDTSRPRRAAGVRGIAIPAGCLGKPGCHDVRRCPRCPTSTAAHVRTRANAMTWARCVPIRIWELWRQRQGQAVRGSVGPSDVIMQRGGYRPRSRLPHSGPCPIGGVIGFQNASWYTVGRRLLSDVSSSSERSGCHRHDARTFWCQCHMDAGNARHAIGVAGRTDALLRMPGTLPCPSIRMCW